uniref:Slc6a-13 n=1 Tax=Schmidtea mediterranea TaxID=79327 RepID=A0A0H3YK17_SCHMD|nr:slc6a-13 [Schmidtea mediterranea]
MYSNIQNLYKKNLPNKFWRTDAKRRISNSNLKKDNSSISGDLQSNFIYDIEEGKKLIQEYNARKRSGDVYNDIIISPTQYLECCLKLRPIRTIKMPQIENNDKINSKLEAYNASYNKDFVYLKSKFEGCNKMHLQCQIYPDESITCDPPVYEISMEQDVNSNCDNMLEIWEGQSLNNIQSDPLITGLLNDISSESALLQSLKFRQKYRQSKLFNLYMAQDLEKQIEFQNSPEFPRESVGKSLKIYIKSFKLEYDVEPIFGSMCLYNLKNRKKISENFYFDFNDASKVKLLDEKFQHQFTSRSQQANACIFHVDNLADIFLVIRIEKILQQGDANDIVDAYLKDDKHKSKFKTQIEWSCRNLSRYRMPFGIYAMSFSKDVQSSTFQSSTSIDSCSINSASMSVKSSRLSTNSKGHPLEIISTKSASQSQSKDINLLPAGSFEDEDFDILNASFKTSLKSISSFYRQESEKMSDDDLFKWLLDLRKPNSSSKKLKTIPCFMELQISSIDEMNCNEFVMSPEHIPLANKFQSLRNSKKLISDRPIMDILEFPTEKRFIAHAIYRNLLYVYPKSVNFNSKQGSGRNITIQVQFYQLEGEKQKLLKSIYDKCNGPRFVAEAFTKVLYHNKNPEIHDEIKIRLPGRVTANHYLLFTFYHVSCQANKKSDGATMETLIGYSWLPILENEILRASEHSLLVSTEKPHPKIVLKKPDLQNNIENVHWVENHKELFRVFIQPVSTVHSDDPVIEKFNNAASNIRFNINCKELEKDKVNLIESSKMLESCQLIGLVQFSSIIFDNLIWLSLYPDDTLFPNIVNVQQFFLNLIGALVSRFSSQSLNKNENTNRDSILVTYVTYAACLPGLESETEFMRCYNIYNKSEKFVNKYKPDDAYLNPENYHVVTGLFHEDFLSRILQSIDDNNYVYIMDNLWFFLELLIRGMKEYFYYISNFVKSDHKPIFSDLFVNKLMKLARFATQQIDRHILDSPVTEELVNSLLKRQCQNLIRNLAMFYKSLLTLLNSDVIKMIIVDFFGLVLFCAVNLLENPNGKSNFYFIVSSNDLKASIELISYW